ncbi:MAG: hypothetical protein H0Z24_06915 [Thermosipho sp. (in: Bacteria)]|nr:hypothetical protein [Thermosipho sp. (in: thermotogales)]
MLPKQIDIWGNETDFIKIIQNDKTKHSKTQEILIETLNNNLDLDKYYKNFDNIDKSQLYRINIGCRKLCEYYIKKIINNPQNIQISELIDTFTLFAKIFKLNNEKDDKY